jgi:SAM-dependent methyltransferase
MGARDSSSDSGGLYAGGLYAGGLYELGVCTARSQSIDPVSPCPVCASELAYRRFEVESFASPVVACTRCGLGRFHPMLGKHELDALYPAEYYGEPGTKFQPIVERLVRAVGERHIGFLMRGLPPGARILDVGCGRGVILGALADRGFEVHGQEISAGAAYGADSRAEIRIANHLSDAGYEAGFFDEIIIWHVLEHLPDPRGTLEEAHRILKPGGRLIVAVPNFSSLQARATGPAWFHLDLPRHLYQFPLGALRDLISSTGFEVGSAHHFSLRQNPFGWIQSVLNGVPGLPRNGLYTLLHHRGRGEPPPFDPVTRGLLWLALIVGAPLGIAATLVGTALRSGATVHVVATR